MTSDAWETVEIQAGERQQAESNTVQRPTREYRADGITVQWYAKRCRHSGNCVRALPRVFDSRRRPWIDVHAAEPDEIARAVELCPSGALKYIRHHEES